MHLDIMYELMWFALLAMANSHFCDENETDWNESIVLDRPGTNSVAQPGQGFDSIRLIIVRV